MMLHFRKKKKYVMDIKTADKTLQNVFAACNKEPNSIPFDKLLLRQKLNTKGYTCRMWISFAILLLTFLAPLAFKPSSFKLASSASSDRNIQIVESHTEDNGQEFVLTLMGDDIDYDHITMTDQHGNSYQTISCDPDAG